jgi:protein O-mannosyl-transferase
MPTEPNCRTENSGVASILEKYIVALILLVTAATYLGASRFEFVYDDTPVIVDNPFIKAWHFVPQYFTSSAWKQMGTSVLGNYYRPLIFLLIRVTYALFGGRPLGWHLLAITMHLVVTGLTYILIRKITGEITTAWLAALIFGVHPIHHEVVAWVTGMVESLFAIFFLLAFLAYLRSRKEAKAQWMTLSCFFYALAVLSKETAIILPALVFAHGWSRYSPAEPESRPDFAAKFRSAFIPASLYLPITVLYLSMRNWVLSGLGHSVAQVRPVTWVITLPSILLFYVRNWFFPFRFSEFYDLFYQPRLDFVHVILPALILLALGACVWILRNRMGANSVDCAVAWIVIPLLPALDTFVFKSDELVHDRYFYLPSIGAALLVALFISRCFRSRSVVFEQPIHVVVIGAALTIVLASLAGWSANFWRSDYALYSRGHQVAPLNTTAISDLAGEMILRNDPDRAQELLETGYRNNPTDFQFPLGLGHLYYNKGEYAKAELFLLQVRDLAPNQADSYVLLGEIRLKQNRPKEAQENMRNAARLNPYSWSVHSIYGVVLALNGDCSDAEQEFQAALALNPGDALTQVQMARCQASLPPGEPPATKPGQL